MDTSSEGVTIIAGKVKTRKISLALSFIEKTQGEVLYIDLERRVGQHVFSDLPKNRLDDITFVNDWPRGMDGVKRLEAWLKEFPETKLVIINSFNLFRGGPDPATPSHHQDYTMRKLLNAVGSHHHILIIATHHTRPDAPDGILDDISGDASVIWTREQDKE